LAEPRSCRTRTILRIKTGSVAIVVQFFEEAPKGKADAGVGVDQP
jgi:hypothetical protein